MNFRCLFFLLFVTAVQGQNLDSLRHVVAHARSTHDPRIDLYLDRMARAYSSEGLYDSAKICYQELLKINQSRKVDSLTAISMNDLGVAFYKLNDFDSCIYYYKRALDVYRRIDDPLKQASIEINLSIIYKDKGWYDDALELALRAASKLESRPPDLTLGSCYNNIGLIYGKLKNLTYSMSYLRKALAIRRLLNNQKGVGQSYNNIANLFNQYEQYDSAYFYFLRSLEIKRSLKDYNSTASTLNNLGDVLLALQQPTEAEAYYRESLLLKQKQGDRVGEAHSWNSLGKIELFREHYPKAKTCLDRAEEIELDLGLLQQLQDTYELRVELSKRQHDFKAATLYAEKLLAVRDSLMTKEKAQSLAEIQTRYETEKKEQRISLLEQEKELQASQLQTNRLWIIVLLGGALLLVVIGALIFNQYRISQRNKDRVEVLLQELHHRVKNNLQILSSVLSLQSHQLTDIHAIQAVKSSESRVNAMALIHRKLYGSDQARTINMKSYTTELVNYLVHTYGYSGKELRLRVEVEEIDLDVDQAIPVGLILNELISNSFKYAFEDHLDPELTLSMTRQNHSLHLHIADNGKGVPVSPALHSRSSFGLKMVNMLMAELRGSLTVAVLHGTQYDITLPIR